MWHVFLRLNSLLFLCWLISIYQFFLHRRDWLLRKKISQPLLLVIFLTSQNILSCSLVRKVICTANYCQFKSFDASRACVSARSLLGVMLLCFCTLCLLCSAIKLMLLIIMTSVLIFTFELCSCLVLKTFVVFYQ